MLKSWKLKINSFKSSKQFYLFKHYINGGKNHYVYLGCLNCDAYNSIWNTY